jgi:hypothetical protein
MNKWEGIFENWRRFLFITYQITKTSLIFAKCVMVREILDTEVALRNLQSRFRSGSTKFPVAATRFDHKTQTTKWVSLKCFVEEDDILVDLLSKFQPDPVWHLRDNLNTSALLNVLPILCFA